MRSPSSFVAPNDRVGIKADTSSDAKIIGRQLTIEKLVLSCEILYFHISTSSKVHQLMGKGKNQYIASMKIKTLVVEYKTAFAFQAYHVDATIAQFSIVNTVEICRIYKFYLLHKVKLQCFFVISKQIDVFVKI